MFTVLVGVCGRGMGMAELIKCRKCNASNTADAETCVKCGEHIKANFFGMKMNRWVLIPVALFVVVFLVYQASNSKDDQPAKSSVDPSTQSQSPTTAKNVYEGNAQERLNLFMSAWKSNDYPGMVQGSSLRWRLNETDPILLVQTNYDGLADLVSYEVVSAKENHDGTVVDFRLSVTWTNLLKNTTQTKTIDVKSFKEDAAGRLSKTDGVWGINPVFLLSDLL